MPRPLRQSTASQAVVLGPFLDSADGNTQETALSIANTDIRLRKAGGAAAAKNSGGASHDAAGYYLATLDATDTNTVGPLLVSVHVAGALAVWLECVVLEEAVYDALFAASAAGYSTYAGGAVASVTGNVGGNVVGSVGSVTGAVGSVTAAVTLPTIPNNWITAAGIAADAITDAKVASDVTIAGVTGSVGSVTGNVGGNVTGSVGSVTGNVGGNVVGSVGSVVGNVGGSVASVVGNVGGNVAGSVGSVAASGITASSLAPDCITAAKIADGAIDTATFASGTTLPRVTLVDTTTANTDMLTAAGVRAAVGLANANLDTQLDALPTNADLATALAGADDAVLAAIAALSIPTATQNATGLLDLAAGVESGMTVRQALRAITAALAGDASADGATYYAPDGTTQRLGVVQSGASGRTVTRNL